MVWSLGSGKTTLVKKLVEKLRFNGIHCLSGFYTEELTDSKNIRYGFDVVDLNNGKRNALARVKATDQMANHQNMPSVGKYQINVKSFESIAIPSLKVIWRIHSNYARTRTLSNFFLYLKFEKTKHILIVDEIGKMESFSPTFEKELGKLLEAVHFENFIIIATVPLKNLKLSDKFKSHTLANLYNVSLFKIFLTYLNKIEFCVFKVTPENRDNLLDNIYEKLMINFHSLK